MFLKISQDSQESTCAGPCRPLFTEHLRWRLLDFSCSKYFFQLNLVFIADSRTRFCSELLWKHDLNLRLKKQPLELFSKKGVLRNFANFTEKHLPGSPFLIELQEVSSFIQKRLRYRFYKCTEFTKFLRTPNFKSVNGCFWNLFFDLGCPFQQITLLAQINSYVLVFGIM